MRIQNSETVKFAVENIEVFLFEKKVFFGKLQIGKYPGGCWQCRCQVDLDFSKKESHQCANFIKVGK